MDDVEENETNTINKSGTPANNSFKNNNDDNGIVIKKIETRKIKNKKA